MFHRTTTLSPGWCIKTGDTVQSKGFFFGRPDHRGVNDVSSEPSAPRFDPLAEKKQKEDQETHLEPGLAWTTLEDQLPPAAPLVVFCESLPGRRSISEACVSPLLLWVTYCSSLLHRNPSTEHRRPVSDCSRSPSPVFSRSRLRTSAPRHYYTMTKATPEKPVILGSEGSGVVEQTSEGSSFQVGQKAGNGRSPARPFPVASPGGARVFLSTVIV